ncbi:MULTISPECIES: sigma-G-dependent sporulation-specific acid-soluble spore protein CsgA [Bacillaceae]|uniref:Sigma-G-dependent sporulation-specific acid-soluble spore protein CsgA n=1 Tax=Evansella alkalicola TaxID=745819 RepID=A0ABS6JVG7_9BACI|nr:MULTISPECIES: sigma-G-dependent sporulation-specific acid-soluble spore protein CsgA [Bacillaceae]MBU9722086.1 sigma-G-dependent sporulation-specific acid-soluble spore protein CsgA [Bacillus alkalicola]
MDKTLGYLRESLSNHIEYDEVSRQIYEKLESNDYKGEGEFVKDLNTEETEVLNKIIKDEIEYAKEELDDKRALELNEVYELLF